MYLDVRATDNKSTRDRTLGKVHKSPSIMIYASGISNTIKLSSDPNELFDRIKLILQEKQAKNHSDIINVEIVVTLDKLIEYKCISKKQHKQYLFKCNPIHSKKK